MPWAALAADPQISSFIDDPDPVPAGGLYSYTLRVDNNSTEAALNTRLVVAVPSGAAFVSATPAAANCGVSSPTEVECNLGTLGALGADVREVVLTWRALGPGPATISATATLSASNDTNPANNTQSAVTTVISGANLRMTKTGTPNPVVGGALVTYALTAANLGPNDAGAIVITDNLPPAVSFISASGSGWTCSNAALVVTCTRPGPHPVSGSIPPVTLVGRVNAAGGTITNSASVAPAALGGVADPDSSNNTATVDTVVVAGADVRIAQKTVTSALPAVAGSNVTFVISPRNGGPAAATDALVQDTLPTGWTHVSSGGPNWNCNFSSGQVLCRRTNFPAGALDDITIVATAPPNVAISPAGSNFTNTASISANSNDPDPSNNSGSVSFAVLRDGADLRLSKSKTPNPVAQGSNMVSTIVVTNNGPQLATGPLRVVELLDGETYVAPFPGGGWTCDASGAPVLVCTHPNAGGLAVGASLPALSITTRADTNGPARNTACTGNSVPPGANPALASPPAAGDPNNGNDCATTTSTATTVQPDLAITKQTTTPTGADTRVTPSEGSVTYVLTVSNVSAAPQDATGIVITDDIPAFINGSTSYGVISAVPSAGSTALIQCSTADARVTCTQSGGRLRQGESVVVSITVNRPLFDGSYTNTASVANVAQGDPNPNNNQATSPVLIDPIADVEMTGKTVTPGSVRAGEVATYVLSFRNNGPSPAAGVQVSDTFTFPGGDSGLTVLQIDSSAPGSTCNVAAGAVLNPAQNALNCTIGTLARGETQTVTLRVRPNFQAGNGSRSFSNVARIDTTTAESPSGGDNGNNVQSAALAITPAAIDLLVNKTDRVGNVNLDPVPYAASAFLGYQVNVTNNGPSYATGVLITENMTPPASRRIRFVCDVTAFGGTTCNAPSLCSAGSIGATSISGQPLPPFTCSVPAGNASTGTAAGELAVGATKSIWLRFEALDQPAATGDVYNNVAIASANEPDTLLSNNNESEQTTTRQRISLTTTKSSSNPNPNLMQPFNWQVAVTNAGPGNSLRTDLTDTLPPEAEVTGPITWTRTLPAGNGSCTSSAQTVSCALGQLDATGSATVTIPVRITRYPSGGTLTNTATVDNDPEKTGGLDTPGGTNTGTQTLPVQRSSLAGVVFDDRDRTGPNAGTPQAPNVDPRIPGVTLTLSGTDAYGNAITRTTTTDSNGNYLFNDLPPSGVAGYTVTETQPFGYANGPSDPPTAGPDAPSIAGSSYASGSALGNSSFSGIVLGSSVNGTRFNFPEQRRGTLAGFVYIDVNRNGVRDAAADLPIANATVRLYNATSGVLLATTTTGADGAYVFVNLDPAIAYTVEEPLPTQPAGLVNGSANAGLIGGAPCPAGCVVQPNTPVSNTDRITNIDLQTGFDGTGFNFGEIQTASIRGLVWVDDNRDTVLDAAETTRLSGVNLSLVVGANCATGTVLQTTVTTAAGTYAFDGLEAYVDYWVCQTQPAGYGTGSAKGTPGSNAIRVLALPPAGSSNNDFGETLGSLSGAVYLDTGAGVGQYDNGQRDIGETGLAGVTITLSGRDITGAAVNRTTTTDSSGNYRFDGLLQSGTSGYSVTEGPIPPLLGSFADGRDTAGSAGGNNAVNDTLSGIVLAAGVDATGYLFGELTSGSIAGSVYIDRDRGGALDAADTRLSGVTIRLVQGADCASGTLLQTTTTNASGNYFFNNVAAGGNYLLCEEQPPGLGNGSDTPGAAGSSAGVNTIRITGLPAGGSSGNNFGEVAGGIAGSVYADYSAGNPANTDNGQRDAAEVGIAGVAVTLSGRDITGSVVSRTATTDGNGNYRFDDLLQSDAAGYRLVEGAIPAAAGTYNDGRDTAGSVGGSNAVNDQLSAVVLPAGVQATGYNFGELPVAPITGTVYLDTDRSGTLGAGDGRLAGVVIRLVLGSNCSGTVVATTNTDSNGNYLFSGASAGLTYTVCETQPSGYGDGAVNPGANGSSVVPNAITISNLPAAGSAGNHFGELAGSLAGSVYVDFSAGNPASTNNGVRDPGEPGIAGVIITLSGRDITGAAITRSATTDADGNYRFDDLPQSDAAGYSVSEGALPAAAGNYADGRDSAGSAGGSNAVNDVLSGVVLGAAVQATAYNFGELPVAAISGTVYIDRNRNGLPDGPPVDGVIAGVTLRLVRGADCSSGTVLQTTTTNANGAYSFTSVGAGGDYLICETQPVGYGNGAENPGTAGSTAGANVIRITQLPPGGSTNNHFGERAASLSGSVWLDSNNDGVRQSTGPVEAGIAGVTVTLSGIDAAGNSISRSTVTDAGGNYRFDDLPAAGAAGYAVSEQAAQPVVGGVTTLNGRTVAGSTAGAATPVATLPSRISGIALAAGGESTDNRFGEILPVSLSGVVFIDPNNNGLQDPATDTGLPGVTLVITGTDDSGSAVTRSIVTAADGSYAVNDLRPGTYNVNEPAQPAGTTNGLTVPGSVGGTATAVAVTPSAISGIVLGTPGAKSTANNFAEIPGNSAIEGRVWIDINNNGLIDGSEIGIAGITVQLSGIDGQGRNVSRTTLTDASGNYRFDQLLPGTYTVTEPTQPPGTVNGLTVPGSSGGSATPVATVPSAITGIVLAAGVNSSANNFGERLSSPDLRVSKSLVESALTVGFQGHYRISVANRGDIASSGSYTVSDRLPAGLTLAATPTGSGWTCSGGAGAASFTCSASTVIAAGAVNPDTISATVNVAASAAAASPVNNAVLVEGGGELDGRGPSNSERDTFNGNPAALPVCAPAIDHNACRTPTVVQLPASLSGTVWLDGGTRSQLLDGGDTRLQGWLVEVVDPATGVVVGTAMTAADGSYQVRNLQPGIPLVVRFRDPSSGVVFGYPVNGENAPGSSGATCDTAGAPAAGKASSCVGTGASPWLTVVLAPGQDLPQQSLPVDPGGIVYDSGTRQPVPGSVVTLAPVGTCGGWSPGTAIVGAALGGYAINGAQISMTVGSSGYYQFLFSPHAPASCTFGVTVTPPAGYSFTSTAIPPSSGPLVPAGGSGGSYAVQPQAGAPTAAVGAGTTYYLTITAGSGVAQTVHNHIPLDAAVPPTLALSKVADRAAVELGDTLRYSVTVSVTAGSLPRQTTVLDRLPAGFTYVRGSASVDDRTIADPLGGLGPTLAFNLGAMPASRQVVLRYRVRIAVGAQQGDGVNRARAWSCAVLTGCVDANLNPVTGSVGSNEGAYRVRVSGGVFTTDACVVGKIFVDCNGNHVQDAEELGIPGVRLLMQDGSTLISDSEGKYSLCGVPPKSAVLKVDALTLPRGARLTTSSSRNLGDAGSLWLDLKNGELHRADFIEGSCTPAVIEQVKARRAQGEIRAPQPEKQLGPALRFESPPRNAPSDAGGARGPR